MLAKLIEIMYSNSTACYCAGYLLLLSEIAFFNH